MKFVVNFVANVVFFIGVIFTVLLLGKNANDIIMAARGRNPFNAKTNTP